MKKAVRFIDYGAKFIGTNPDMIDPVEGGLEPAAGTFLAAISAATGKKPYIVGKPNSLMMMLAARKLGVHPDNILFDNSVPAGHSLITDNPEDNPLDANRPPYINNGGFMQSQRILEHIYGPLKPPSPRLSGRIIRFDQTEFFDGEARASMSPYGYAYVPRAVEEGKRQGKVHIALHGCKQGYAYVNFVNGQADLENSVPYGNRYFTTTGYNEIADANDIIVLYPQAQGRDDGHTQNPDGCWDWWGYTSQSAKKPDYYSKNAIQIQAIYRMLQRLGGQ